MNTNSSGKKPFPGRKTLVLQPGQSILPSNEVPSFQQTASHEPGNSSESQKFSIPSLDITNIASSDVPPPPSSQRGKASAFPRKLIVKQTLDGVNMDDIRPHSLTTSDVEKKVVEPSKEIEQKKASGQNKEPDQRNVFNQTNSAFGTEGKPIQEEQNLPNQPKPITIQDNSKVIEEEREKYEEVKDKEAEPGAEVKKSQSITFEEAKEESSVQDLSDKIVNDEPKKIELIKQGEDQKDQQQHEVDDKKNSNILSKKSEIEDQVENDADNQDQLKAEIFKSVVVDDLKRWNLENKMLTTLLTAKKSRRNLSRAAYQM